MRNHFLSHLRLVGFTLLAACGGDDLVLPVDGEAAAIEVLDGGGQNGPAGEALRDPIVVRVTDRAARPVGGAAVAFVVEGAATDPDTAMTGSDGLASTSVVLGSSTGAAGGLARVVTSGSGAPIEVAFTVTALPASAGNVRGVSGDAQAAPAGTELPDRLVVEVTDTFGNPVEGIAIDWSADGGGSVSDPTTTTGSDGRASVSRTLGPAAGPQATLASAEELVGSPVTFDHTAQSGGAAGVRAVSGSGQTAEPGAVLPEPLVVEVTDRDGNFVEGASVTWVVTGGGGLVSPATSATDAQGRATTTWTLGPDPGANNVEAVLSGVGEAMFSAVATEEGASVLALVTQPSDEADAGEAFDRQPVIQLRDAAGDDIGREGVRVTVAIASGDGRLIGQVNRNTDLDGRATFRDLGVEDGSGPHTLIFAAQAFLPVTSLTVEVFGQDDNDD